MNWELVVAVGALVISLISAAFVFWEIRVATAATRAQLFVSIIDDIHRDDVIQTLLAAIYKHDLSTKRVGEKLRVMGAAQGDDATETLDRLLGRFQILGHLVRLRVLRVRDLQSLKFEVVVTGRDPTVQEYLCYLNGAFVQQSGVSHNHFEFFKTLYTALETDARHRNAFRRCLDSGAANES